MRCCKNQCRTKDVNLCCMNQCNDGMKCGMNQTNRRDEELSPSSPNILHFAVYRRIMQYAYETAVLPLDSVCNLIVP